MDQKTISWVSYITLIGWIIALVSYNGSPDKSSLARLHIRQSLGIFVTGLVFYIGVWILVFVIPFIFFLFPIIWILLLVMWIMGLVSAANGQEKPLPVVGDLYQKMFSFIN